MKRILPYAAAIVLLIGIGSIFFLNINQAPSTISPTSSNSEPVLPGGNRATLLLDGGRSIDLDDEQEGIVMGDGKITYTDGSLIVAENSNISSKQYTVLTPKGGTYQLCLPDGTNIWLNADSRLSYSADLAKINTRKVRLEGEAYFEVSKDAHRPFIVTTAREQITVLGTQFNVNSYRDETTGRTTLVEGSVRINGNTVLKPGQQAVVDQKGKLRLATVNADKIVAWKNGKFVFESEPIESVMKKIGRWYDVEPVYKGAVSDRNFSGTLSRFEDIQKVLDKITYTSDVRFKLEGRRVIVMP
ncbi:FecR family protein [Sphingobacterium kyonggiense]